MDWEWVDGYNNETYTDEMIFIVDPNTKIIQQIDDQILVSGENKSQFIRFEMPRYYDGVDLSTKTIQIIYRAPNDWSDINIACCVQRNEEKIRFGWIVPAAACYEPGDLMFGIEAVGDDYVWKSRTYDIEVYDGLNGAEEIPEPEEKAWYIELQERCDYILNQANAAKEAAAGSATTAAAHEANALDYKAQAENSKTAAAGSATAAAGSAASAELYAEQAASVFDIAGEISASISDDGGVTLIFTKEDES